MLMCLFYTSVSGFQTTSRLHHAVKGYSSSIAAVVHELTLIDTNRRSSTSGTAVDIGSQSLTCYLTFHL